MAVKNNIVTDALLQQEIPAKGDVPTLDMAVAQDNDVQVHNMRSSHSAL